MLILALCLLAVLVPVPLVGLALFVAVLTLATTTIAEAPVDLQRAARLAVLPFRAPPAARPR